MPVIYNAGRDGEEETEAERRRRARHSPSGSFSDEEGWGHDLSTDDAYEGDPDERTRYRDAGGEGYGYDGSSGAYGHGGGYDYDASGGSGSGGGGGGGVSDFDRTSADIPIWGWLSGADERVNRANAESDRERNDRLLRGLYEWMPTADDFAVNYAPEDYIGDEGAAGETREGRLAREAMEEWSRGGFSDADRAMMDEARRREGMGARADREALMSSMDARGMGGSGAALAGMLGAGEAAADRSASMESGILGAAQARQERAVSNMRDADARERGVTDDWTRYEADYARGREGRNTERENETRESRSSSRQQAYENNRDVAMARAGLDPYGGRGSPDDDHDEAAAAGLGGLLSEIFG